MKNITLVETFDSMVHRNHTVAKHHLDKLYGDLLLRMGRDLANQKYSFVTEYIDGHLADFAQLQRIKNDYVLTNPEED